jgi:zinc transporter, ZIP family
VILAAVFLDLLPDAVQRAIDLHMSVTIPLGCVLLGYLTFQLTDHIIHEHSHPDGTAPDPAGVAGAAGFIIHSFFDGLAIGLGFRVSSSLGILVAAAVVGHDFSDGLSTVSYLKAHHQSEGRSRWFLLADAATPLCGALVASLAPVPLQVFPIALGFFSGLFVFAAATDLLPRAEDLPVTRSVPIVGLGVLGMFLVTRLA